MRKAFKPFAFLAALAPAFLPRAADAEVVISTTTSAPVLTSTGADHLRIASGGAVNATSGSFAVRVNSNHNFTNEGVVSFVDTNNSVALLIDGGVTSNFSNSGSITNLENFDYVDSDSDGDLDSPFATVASTGRYGVRLQGASAITGSFTQSSAGIVEVEGNSSTAFAVDAPLVGTLDLNGGLSVLGNNSYAFRNTGAITGDVLFKGSVSALGENAVAVQIDNSITGALRLEATIQARGYRFTSRPTDDQIAKFEADDMLQGGPAVWVRANVTGGVFVNTAPADASTTDDDEDDDGLLDVNESGAGTITSYGSAPAIRLGDSGGAAITLGNVGSVAGYQYGFVNDGDVTAIAVLDNVPGTGLRVENVNLSGGLANRGSILGGSFDLQGAGVSIGAASTVPELFNAGSITGVADSDLLASTAYGIKIESGATVSVLRNSGSITANRSGEDGRGVAIADFSNSLHLIENTGSISAVRSLTDDSTDTDDADINPDNEVLASTARNIAIDLSAQTTGSTIRQLASTDSTPLITGEVLFGSGNDVLDIQGGALAGDIDFGAGATQSFSISGDATVTGALANSGGLAIDLSAGRFNMANLNTVNGTSLNLGSAGTLELQVDPTAAQNGRLALTGAATFAAGSNIDIVLRSPVVSTTVGTTYTLISAGSISGAANVNLDSAPFMMDAHATPTATTVDITLRRKSAADLGLNANETAFYEPFFAAALGDASLMQTLLGLGTQESFTEGFNQFLPNATGAQADFAATRAQAMTSLLFSRYYGPVQNNREIYAWTHELLYSREREATTTGQGFEGFGFGFAAGVDGPMGKTGYKGYGLSFTSDEFDEKHGVDKPFTVSSLELMGHVAQPAGPVLLGGRIGVGYDRYSSKRRVEIQPDLNAPSLSRSANADWSGAHVSANLRAALPRQVGIFRLRPELGLDAVSMWEQDYTESGGGVGVDMGVDARQSTRVSASATVAAGLHWQAGGFIFNPELMVGARAPLVNEAYESRAHFVSAPGTPFTLLGDTADQTALIAGAAFTVDGQIGSLRLEGQAEQSDGDTAATGRLVVRLTF